MLRKYRECAGVTQEELARRLRVTVRTYVRWENAGIPQQWGQMIELAEILGVRPGDLVPRKTTGHNTAR